MKLLACDKCHAVIKLELGKIKSCKCGNIKGKYVDDKNIVVLVKDKEHSRILGLQNSVRYGLKERGEAWIIPFDNETVTLKEGESK